MKIKKPSQLNYDDVPSIKVASKMLAKAILRRTYIGPKKKIGKVTNNIRDNFYSFYVQKNPLKIDQPIFNKKGIDGLFLVASYTDNDKGYLDGMIQSAEAFSGFILYHDKTKKHNFNYNESLRFQRLVDSAKKNGAKWVLIGSPKTRFSSQFRQQIEPYIKKYTDQPAILGLHERYLWENFQQYAYPSNIVDDAIIYKLFSITDDMKFDNSPIHASQHPINYQTKIDTEASRYYLGRFNIETLKRKAAFYHSKDGKDYSYMYDMGKIHKHHEKVLGIGEFERAELINKK